MKALAVASGIVFWTLVLGAIILIFFPSGDEGEPVAVLNIETVPSAAAPVTTDGVDLPPGFAVAPAAPQRPAAPMLAPPGQGTTMMPTTPGPGTTMTPPPPPPPPPGPSGALETPERQGALPAASVATANLAAGIDQTGGTALDAVVPALIEESDYGPLPRVAADGRRPADVYARPSHYGRGAGGPPRVAVLVSGLAVPGAPDADIIKGLPPPVSVAYGAYGRGVQEWVDKARADGHEVLLALPLEPNNYPAVDPGPHTLLTTLPTDENLKRLQWLMSRYTGYAGVTNHMGSKFVTTQAALRPVLKEMKRRGLIYFDDGSVEGSAVGETAASLGVDYSTAHVQLEPGKMAESLAALEAEAKAQGAAIGVAKAEPSAVKQIAKWAGSLEGKGLVLVPVSTAMRSRRQG
jgi:polysaccharide deacetylase 2 family uncharacterized protein YibQ